jgi:hypothetical protein
VSFRLNRWDCPGGSTEGIFVMGSVTRAIIVTGAKRAPAMARRETVGMRARRLFRDHAATLNRVHTPHWEDASPAVRNFWMETATHMTDMG